MKLTRATVAVFVSLAFAPLALAGCSAQQPVAAPVTVDVAKLQGTTVKVPLDSALNINTGDLSVTSYSGKVAKPSIATFVAGRKSQGAEFNPGLKPLAVGETQVTLTNSDGGIQNVTFTLDVTG